MSNVKFSLIGALCASLITSVASAGTLTLGFNAISNNTPANAAAGESQLRVTISMMGSDVNFRFFHDGMVAASIAGIYFDDRSPRLSAGALTPSGPGVSFSAGGSPPGLPGGAGLTPSFVNTQRFTSTNPPPMNGVSPGEHLDIKFSILSGDFDSVLSDIALGQIRIGLQVISIGANEGSEQFVNDTPDDVRIDVIPLPTPLSLAGAGLLGLAAIRRRR